MVRKEIINFRYYIFRGSGAAFAMIMMIKTGQCSHVPVYNLATCNRREDYSSILYINPRAVSKGSNEANDNGP